MEKGTHVTRWMLHKKTSGIDSFFSPLPKLFDDAATAAAAANKNSV